MAVRNLREGTVLKSKYRIGQVLGFGSDSEDLASPIWRETWNCRRLW